MKDDWLWVLSAVESLLVAGLLLVAAWPLWQSISSSGPDGSLWPAAVAERMPPYISWDLGLAVAFCVGIYWLLQVLGWSRWAFGLAALLALLPQAPGIWVHSQLEWQRFAGVDISLAADQSPLLAISLFLSSLAGLAALYRAIGLRKLGSLLSSRGVEGPERDMVLVNEALCLAVMIAAAVILASLVVTGGTAFSRIEALPGWAPWAVLTIGGGAAMLFGAFVMLLFRGLDDEVSGPESPTSS